MTWNPETDSTNYVDTYFMLKTKKIQTYTPTGKNSMHDTVDVHSIRFLKKRHGMEKLCFIIHVMLSAVLYIEQVHLMETNMLRSHEYLSYIYFGRKP